MEYQSALQGAEPYIAKRMVLSDFSLFLHHEIEIIFCLSGGFSVTLGGREYRVGPNEAVFIGSMVPHEGHALPETEVLLLEFGPVLLRENFHEMSTVRPAEPVLSPQKEENREIFRLLGKMSETVSSPLPADRLRTLGNLLLLCAELPKIGNADAEKSAKERRRREKANAIAKVLETVFRRYAENLPVSEMADLAGYGRSNFCKIFAEVMGIGFHEYLNRYRVQMAKPLLLGTDAGILEIAEAVGFFEEKTFFRVFRKITGQTPGQYRKGGL